MNSKNSMYSTLILGVPVSATTYDQVVEMVQTLLLQKKRSFIGVANTHLIMECQKNWHLKKGLQKALFITPDGMPLVWLSKMAGQKKVERVYGPDLMLKLCRVAHKNGYKIFLLGGLPGTTERLKKKLSSLFPKIQIVGSLDTPNRQPSVGQNKAICSAINASQPDIVFVGMGCPFQENWIVDNRSQLTAGLLIGVGAAFDFISGSVKQAPAWMQRSGLEWFFRLVQTPRRLWYRYLVLGPLFVFSVGAELLTGKVKVLKHHP